jgi:hypothetical protein
MGISGPHPFLMFCLYFFSFIYTLALSWRQAKNSLLSASFCVQGISPWLRRCSMFLQLHKSFLLKKWIADVIVNTFFGSPEAGTQGLVLARWALYHLKHTASPFFVFISVIFNIGSGLCPGCPEPQSSYLCFPGMTGIHYHAQPLVEIGVSRTFCVG